MPVGVSKAFKCGMNIGERASGKKINYYRSSSENIIRKSWNDTGDHIRRAMIGYDRASTGRSKRRID